MIRFLSILSALLLLFSNSSAQGPVLSYGDLLTISFEDLSDVVRRYPGMYPVDYGTMGSPLLIRPWKLNPWEVNVELDGIPQQRSYDGLYDYNLQPASELDTIRYSCFDGPGGGTIRMSSRALPVDSPYTELQIREGFYGYGTVDYAHAQRVYQSTTVEVTGRLVWYDGLRQDISRSRFERVRGRFGFSIGRGWRSELVYAGSNVEAQLLLAESDPYSEREEGILRLRKEDSLKTSLSPEVNFYLRQDRETWGSYFRARELTRGMTARTGLDIPYQRLTLKTSARLSSVDFPGLSQWKDLTAGFAIYDSVDASLFGLRVGGELRRESIWNGDTESKADLAGEVSGHVFLKRWNNLQLHGGAAYTEQLVPSAWQSGVYKISTRPLLIQAVFADTSMWYKYQNGYNPSSRLINRYLKTAGGLNWTKGRSLFDIQVLLLDRSGRYADFVETDTLVTIAEESNESFEPQAGLSVTASLPLYYGLRIDSWWFTQAERNDLSRAVDTRSYSRLYFERNFFKAPLTIRAHVSYEHIGKRREVSNYGSYVLGPDHLFGFRFSATIRGVTLIWGTENLGARYYNMLPGYLMIRKEEYFGVIWRLWL